MLLGLLTKSLNKFCNFPQHFKSAVKSSYEKLPKYFVYSKAVYLILTNIPNNEIENGQSSLQWGTGLMMFDFLYSMY